MPALKRQGYIRVVGKQQGPKTCWVLESEGANHLHRKQLTPVIQGSGKTIDLYAHEEKGEVTMPLVKLEQVTMPFVKLEPGVKGAVTMPLVKLEPQELFAVCEKAEGPNQPFVRSIVMQRCLEIHLEQAPQAVEDQVWVCGLDLAESLMDLFTSILPVAEGGVFRAVMQWGAGADKTHSLEEWWFKKWRGFWNPQQKRYMLMGLGWPSHYTSLVVCHQDLLLQAYRGETGPGDRFGLYSMDSGLRFAGCETPRLDRLHSLLVILLGMDANHMLCLAGPGGGQDAINVCDELAMAAMARQAHARLCCVQQADMLNNCAFHNVLQLGSAVDAITERVAEGKSWPLGGLYGPDVTRRMYGGKVEAAQQMREDSDRRTLDAARPASVLASQKPSFGQGLQRRPT